MKGTYFTQTARQTEDVGERLGARLSAGDTVALFGGLGAGKTAFTRGIAKGLQARAETVCSPTFAIMNEYIGRCRICHYDMYRIESWEDLDTTGFFENAESAVSVVEWSENIENALPLPRWEVHISKGEKDDDRRIDIDYLSLGREVL